MNRSLSDRTIALAGIFQAAALVQDLANGRTPAAAALEASVASIFRIDADNVPDVFGGTARVCYGLEQVCSALGASVQPGDMTVMGYALGLLRLEPKLRRQSALLQALRAGIEKARTQAAHFGQMHHNVMANLADVYLRTIGTINPRIMVSGDAVHLNNQRTVDSIRTLLLAGMRAAVLWRQCGGSRWSLVLSRGRLAAEAARLAAVR